jgi:hypothetical protein
MTTKTTTLNRLLSATALLSMSPSILAPEFVAIATLITSDLTYAQSVEAVASVPVLPDAAGTWRPTNTGAPSWAHQSGAVAIQGDFNNDGRTDVAFHRPGSNWGTVPVLFANGDGSWRATNQKTPTWPHAPGVRAVPGDYNNDGRTDIAFYRPNSSWATVPVLFANGDGSWRATNQKTPTWPHRAEVVAVAGDYNNDGRADIAFHRPIDKSGWGTVPVLFANGDGSWQATNQKTPTWPHLAGVRAVSGDFNDDGRTDIAFHRPNSRWRTVPVLFANGDGSWRATNEKTPTWPHLAGVVAVAGDYDGNGRTDIAFHRPIDKSGWGTVPVLFANGNGTWAATNESAPTWAHLPGARAIAGDYNNDGRTDIAFHRPGSNWSTVPVLFPSPLKGSWQATNKSAPTWAHSNGVFAVPGDYDRDGSADVAFYRPGSTWKTVPALFSGPAPAPQLASNSTPVADGQAGLGLLGYANGELVTQATLAAGSKIDAWPLPADARVLPPTGDFNGDGREDLILWTANGLALVSAKPPVQAGEPGGWQLLTAINNGSKAGGWQIGTDRQIVHGVGDFNGDGRDDLLLTGPNAIGVLTLGKDGLTTLAMHVNGTRLGGWIIDTPKNRIEGLGDFDGNKRADILITSGWGIGVLTLSGSNLTSVMLKPNGTRFGGWLYDSRGNPIRGIGDFDGNGRDDVVLTSGWGIGVLTLAGDSFNSLMLKPNGTRFGGWLYDSGANPIRGVGDFDGNGRDDLIITSGWGIGVLTLAGDSFNSLMLKPKGTRFGGWLYDPANSIGQIGDFDGNARDDFVISSGWGVGILTLAGDTFNSLTLKPHGTQLKGWTLAKNDALPAAANLTSPKVATLAMQRRTTGTKAAVVAARSAVVSVEQFGRDERSAWLAHARLRNLLLTIEAEGQYALDPTADPETVNQFVSKYYGQLDSYGKAFQEAQKRLGESEDTFWASIQTDWSVPVVITDVVRSAFIQLQVELRYAGGPIWRTQIESLKDDIGCRVDILGDALIARYGDSVVRSSAARPTETVELGKFGEALACMGTHQIELFDTAFDTAFRKTMERLDKSGMRRAQGAFIRYLAPLQVLLLDATKHRGRLSPSWHWFVKYRSSLINEVDRLGWATGDWLWLYDRIDGRLIGFERCGDSFHSRCIDVRTFLESLVDPRALGAGDCAFSGMVARGRVKLSNGGARYACPTVTCGSDSSSSGDLTPQTQTSPTRQTTSSGTRLTDSLSLQGGSASWAPSESGDLTSPWSLSAADWQQMSEAGFCRETGKGSNSASTQGPAGSVSDWGGIEECFKADLATRTNPFTAYAQCVVDASSGPDPLDLGSQYLGVPTDQRCGLMSDGDTGTGSTDTADGDSGTDDDSNAKKIWNAVTTFFSAVSNLFQSKGGGALGPIIDVETKLLDPENGKKIYDGVGAAINYKVELYCAGGQLGASECDKLAGMKPGDQAQYLNDRGLKSCADPTDCQSSCSAFNEQMAATRECRQEMLDALITPPGETPDPLINWGPDGPPGDSLSGLTACLLGPNAGMPNRGNLQCGLVTCVDGLSTRDNAARCCGDAGIPMEIPVFSVCLEAQCPESMSGIGPNGSCLCGSLPVEGTEPIPAPQPAPEGISLPSEDFPTIDGLDEPQLP